MNRLQVSDLGPIKEADITFGDLTLLVGPQASGKSILLQLLKLIPDIRSIRGKLEQYNFSTGKTETDMLNRYFGEGMAGIWNSTTKIKFNDREVPYQFLLPREDTPADLYNPQSFFYIPAQRVICLQNGWPRFFSDFDDDVPFVLRDFSETIRLFTERIISLTKSDTSFSQQQELNKLIRQSFDKTIFNQAKIEVDFTVKKRFKLHFGDTFIPFATWSAGQKEFMPLLLSFYYLFSEIYKPSKHFFGEVKVVIEEPEMGLHPQAIKSVMLQILDLMHRGYQVIVSTHSPVLLELLWAINYIKNYSGTTADLFELFSLQPDDSVEAIFKEVIASKTFATYFFDKTEDGVVVKNISTLDAGSDDPAIASWGGLTDFASRSGDVVSKLVANEE